MPGDHLLHRIKEDGSPTHLALFRIVLGLQLFYAANSKVFDYLLFLGEHQNKRTLFPESIDQFIATHAMGPLVVTVRITALLLAVGFLTRLILPILTLAFIALYSFYYRAANAPIQWLYFWFPLAVLCFSRCADRLSLDRYWLRQRTPVALQAYRWPLELMIAWFVYIYFAAGLAKLFPVSNFLVWIQGGTSKEIIYSRFLDSPLFYMFGKPLFNYAESSWLYGVLTAGSLVIELATVLLLFSRRFHLPLVAAVVSMHLFLHLVGVSGFAQSALVLSFAFLPARYFARLDAAGDTATPVNARPNVPSVPRG